MFLRAFCTAMLIAAPACAQTFSPAEQQMLMQPSAIGGTPGTFQPVPAKGASKTAKATGKGQAATGRAAKPASVSISSELNRGGAVPADAPVLRQPREAAQRKPFDQRVPLGPLSLGVQAEAGPRSDSLVTPTPQGLSQFKKDRSDPYVGVSIIDIKR